MAERLEPRRGMVSPALYGTDPDAEAQRREQIRSELQARLGPPPTRKPRAPMDLMGQMTGEEPADRGVEEPEGPDSIEALVERVLGPDIVNAPPACVQEAVRLLKMLKAQGWPTTDRDAQDVTAELKKGKPAQRIQSEFVVKHGGSAY
jgi:hypothetical protein